MNCRRKWPLAGTDSPLADSSATYRSREVPLVCACRTIFGFRIAATSGTGRRTRATSPFSTGGTAAWTHEGRKLVERWKNSNGGTSPVIAGGLLYVYDPRGKLRIYEPTNGSQVASLDAGSGHWNSPIVVDGRIALPEGNANRHANSGVLDIWSAAVPK